MRERNTKQKEIILNTLLNTKIHPSIYELSDLIKLDYPTIGQATIYRNVSKMVSTGQIRKITTKDGTIHYDGDITPHIHLCCTKCTKLVDIFNEEVEKYIKKVENTSNIKVSAYELLLQGICQNCLKKEK